MMQKRPEVVSLTEKLVEIESTTGNEAEVGEYIFNYCLDHGLTAEKQYCTDNRFNVLISDRALIDDNEMYGLLFHGHIDTVPPLDMEDAFIPHIEQGYMHGRGTVDQKGGLAAAITALIQLKESGAKLDKPVCVAAVIDEESEHRGTMKLVESGIRAEAAVITEPSRLRAVVGCKGTLPLKLTITGRAAHGCRPWLGVNAVEKALPLLQELFAVHFEPHHYDDVDEPLVNSINVGIVKAGTAYNNVPDRCEISLDCRISPGETISGMRDKIDQAISAAKEKDPELTVHVSIDRPDWNWEPIKERGLLPSRIPIADPYVQTLKQVHESVFGRKLEYYITDGYAEIDFMLNDLDIPTVLYGPGDPHLCHTAKERISLADLNDAVQMYQALIERLCKDKELNNEQHS